MICLPLPVESNLGASYVNLMMSKYRHTVLKSSKRGIVCSPETQNIILKKLSVVGDVPEVINLYVECTGTLQPLFLKKCPANSDDRSRQAGDFRMHDNKDWGNEREGEYFSRKLSHEWRYACNETTTWLRVKAQLFQWKMAMSAREQQCDAQNSNAGLKAAWTDLGGEKRSKATILVHRQFRIVLVYAHTQSLGKEYGKNLAPCRALSSKWPPRRVLVRKALSGHTCAETGSCAIAHGARKRFAEEGKI